MSGKLSIQHKDDNCACCADPWGEKQKKQKEIDSVNDVDLAKEMNELSFEEREKVAEDVHGVAAVMEETTEMVDKCIKELDEAMSNVPIRKRKAYNKALFLRPSLQTDRKFKLQFLRAEQFDAARAVERMVKHFQQKLDLFGEEKLGKTLTLDDLSEDDLYLYKIGYMMVLPFPDRSGRPIIFGDGKKLDFDIMTADTILRCYFYLMVKCYDDEVAQKKGSCTIMRFSGARRSISKSAELAKRTAYNSHCVPGRNTSFHICYDDPRMDLIINILRFRAEKATRVRTRAHLGSEVENDYKLMTFGINGDGLLQRIKGGDSVLYQQYIQSRRDADARVLREEEELESNTGIVLYPKPKDVLIGRGKPYRNLPGNIVWEVAIQDSFKRFKSCGTQFEKTCILMDVVKSVHDTGARFLERDADAGWNVLDDVGARKKTAVAFRNRARDTSNNNATAVTAVTTTNGAHPREPSAPAPPLVDVPRTLTSPEEMGHASKRARFDEPMDDEPPEEQVTRFNFPW